MVNERADACPQEVQSGKVHNRKMAKVNSITKHTCVAYWELAEFLQVSENPQKQLEMEGHTTFACFKSQLNVDASFMYSPSNAKMKLNISFQADASKKNVPERIIVSLEGQSFVLNPKEDGQWKTVEFKYVFQRRYPEGISSFEKMVNRNRYRPRIPAFNFFIDFPEEKCEEQSHQDPPISINAV